MPWLSGSDLCRPSARSFHCTRLRSVWPWPAIEHRLACRVERAPLRTVTPAEPLAAEEARDQHPLHLGRTLSDLVDLHVPPVTCDGIVLHEAVAAMDLHRLVRGALGGLGREQLAHRGEHPDLIGRFG